VAVARTAAMARRLLGARPGSARGARWTTRWPVRAPRRARVRGRPRRAPADARCAADAYRVSKLQGTGLGLPPLEEIMAHDPDAAARAVRRASERAKQEQIAAARVRTVDAQGRAAATGKRKEAIARVWIAPGSGGIVINGRALDAYFPDLTWRAHVLYPFMATGTLAAFDVRANVRGGGPSGQAQALRHGLAKALQAWEPALRPDLRAEGLLTRDSRVVERKKPGKAKARKSYQWVKR
jgi:small subunit ribosomal protein S9